MTAVAIAAAAPPALRPAARPEVFDGSAWYEANGGRLLALARRACRCDAEAEDLAQAVALDVLARGGPNAPLALLVRHHAGRRSRARARLQVRESAAAADRPEAVDEQLPDQVADLITARISDPFDRAVAALLSEGRSGRDVAEVLGVSAPSVSRAVARLADALR